ncbi:MAG: hypothetical protein JO353_02555 [Phycisphaerae bacterium]|nr:hypothetical protein [Phycisphaerae bacterium]
MARYTNIQERLLISLASAGLLLAAAGCQNDGSSDADFFPADANSPVHKMADAQAAVGAQGDATLYPTHFDGNSLNALGQAKLDSIVCNLPADGPVTIYIQPAAYQNVSADRSKSRQDAVSQYLINSHLTADQFKLVDGPNPDLHYSSADSVANYSKTDTGDASNSAAGNASAGYSGSASAASK